MPNEKEYYNNFFTLTLVFTLRVVKGWIPTLYVCFCTLNSPVSGLTSSSNLQLFYFIQWEILRYLQRFGAAIQSLMIVGWIYIQNTIIKMQDTKKLIAGLCWSKLFYYFESKKEKKRKTCFCYGGMLLQNKFYVKDAFFRFQIFLSVISVTSVKTPQPPLFYLAISASVDVDAHWGTHYLAQSF